MLKDAIIIFVAWEEFFGVAIVCPYCGTKKGSSTTNDKGETVSVQSKGFLMRLKQVVTPNGKIFLIFQKEYGCINCSSEYLSESVLHTAYKWQCSQR